MPTFSGRCATGTFSAADSALVAARNLAVTPYAGASPAKLFDG